MMSPKNVVENYGWVSDAGPCSCEYLVAVIIPLLRKLGVRRVLDLGAGNGSLCADIRRAGFDVCGVEHDSKGVELASQLYPDISFYRYGVEDEPAELLSMEEKFDAVVSTEVVEHLFAPHLLCSYAFDVLKPDGKLIVTTPYHGYWKNLALAVMNKWDFHHNPLWHGGHIKFWSRTTLSQLLEQNGFDVIDFAGAGRFPYFWKSMVLVGKRKNR